MKYKNLIFLMLLCSITHQSSAITRNQVKKGLIVAGCIVGGLYIGKKIIGCCTDEAKRKSAAAYLVTLAEEAASGFGRGFGKRLGKDLFANI